MQGRNYPCAADSYSFTFLGCIFPVKFSRPTVTCCVISNYYLAHIPPCCNIVCAEKPPVNKCHKGLHVGKCLTVKVFYGYLLLVTDLSYGGGWKVRVVPLLFSLLTYFWNCNWKSVLYSKCIYVQSVHNVKLTWKKYEDDWHVQYMSICSTNWLHAVKRFACLQVLVMKIKIC